MNSHFLTAPGSPIRSMCLWRCSTQRSSLLNIFKSCLTLCVTSTVFSPWFSLFSSFCTSSIGSILLLVGLSNRSSNFLPTLLTLVDLLTVTSLLPVDAMLTSDLSFEVLFCEFWLSPERSLSIVTVLFLLFCVSLIFTSSSSLSRTRSSFTLVTSP